MASSPGLLPRWLFFYTIVRLAIIFPLDMFKSKKFIGIDNIRNIFFFCLQIITRLIGLKSLKSTYFYVIVSMSFLIDILFFLLENVRNSYSYTRIVIEITVSVISFIWMVFLHPYYLLYPLDVKE
ncbi:hypothetical protein SLOPH_1680 [Spraguea lophii 42_110]|uniref:Uncharacterized protein n=1 Tax=Spraguea lophii (strain 42_110) TaxID=1358809 RepID=S7XHE8_SPRLO|nr:hypothetical protein SLOPH_1680 [Spraguea lophii 42_110]